MSTTKQDKAFSDMMEGHVNVTLSNASLDECIDFITNEFSPEDVFSEKQLQDWAEEGVIIHFK